MLEMSDVEISRRYLNADHKNKIIRILAELNGCDVLSIIQALNRQGIRLDTRKRPPRIKKGTGRWACDSEIMKRRSEYNAVIRYLLTKHTQADLVRICGIKRQYISLYSRGKSMPSTATFDRMLEGLGMSREEFFSLGKEKHEYSHRRADKAQGKTKIRKTGGVREDIHAQGDQTE